MQIKIKKNLKKSTAYDEYWYFAAARQKKFHASCNGVKDTEDPILADYKFTNCYRVLDRTSQFLVKNIISEPNATAEDVFFRTILYKLFNKIDTWQELERLVGRISVKEFNVETYTLALNEIKESGKKIYSAAYIMPSGKREWGSATKHENNLHMLAHMIEIGMHKSTWELKDLGGIFESLLILPSIGKFLAYQYAVDLAYSDFSDAIESDFVIAGPGATRGINKCFNEVNPRDYTYIIEYMTDIQEDEFERLNLNFTPLKNRNLQLIDCQNIFCEVDKYLRVKRPDLGKPGARIKQKYRPHPEKIEYHLPPKWNALTFAGRR